MYSIAIEMVRTIVACEARAQWWFEKRLEVREDLEDEFLKEGVRAYSIKQAAMYSQHALSLRKRFEEPLKQAREFAELVRLDGLYR